MLQTEINIKVSNKAPNEYMNEELEQCHGQENVYGLISTEEDLYNNLSENAIPSEIIDMNYNNYQKFLEKRRVLMAKKIREFYYSL